jgi:predicted amidohydrolase YtcJ
LPESLADYNKETGPEMSVNSFEYVDEVEPGERNSDPVIPAKAFAEYMIELDKAGYLVKTHAIGDLGVRLTLDGYEAAFEAAGNNRLRHHIDHCSLIHPDDFQRFVDMDISCTIWPPLNAPPGYNVDGIKPVLKPDTWKRMYANRERIDAGMRLANHTDAPAATLWPWFGLEAAITRGFPRNPEKATQGQS